MRRRSAAARAGAEARRYRQIARVVLRARDRSLEGNGLRLGYAALQRDLERLLPALRRMRDHDVVRARLEIDRERGFLVERLAVDRHVAPHGLRLDDELRELLRDDAIG